jgi:hypothetical protein
MTALVGLPDRQNDIWLINVRAAASLQNGYAERWYRRRLIGGVVAISAFHLAWCIRDDDDA